MKRVVENSRESIPASAEVRAMLRHEYLLQDYHDLQKEFVSEKKLQEEKERKQTLLDGVYFLRGRYQYLMELQSSGTRTKEVPVLERETEKDKLAEGKEEADQRRPRE